MAVVALVVGVLAAGILVVLLLALLVGIAICISLATAILSWEANVEHFGFIVVSVLVVVVGLLVLHLSVTCINYGRAIFRPRRCMESRLTITPVTI